MFVLVSVNGRLYALDPISNGWEHMEVQEDYERWFPKATVRTNWVVGEEDFPLPISSSL